MKINVSKMLSLYNRFKRFKLFYDMSIVTPHCITVLKMKKFLVSQLGVINKLEWLKFGTNT